MMNRRNWGCATKRRYNTTVRCYDCGEMVTDLQNHRKHCNDSKIRNWQCKVRCYGCGQEVHDLKRHKKFECGKTSQIITDSNTTDFYMLMDVSSSMMGNRLDDAKDSFREIERTMKETDRIAVVTFDTFAYFKLHPHPVGKIRRHNEIEPLLNRIYAKGMTAIWDAIWLSVEQLANKNQKTLMIVLTDGEDNSSSHSYQEVVTLLEKYPNVQLSIVHIDGSGRRCTEYEQLCTGRGEYQVVAETEIVITVRTVFKKYYE